MMREYAFSDYGILLNEIVDNDDLLDELAEAEIVDSQYSFTGEAFPIDDKGHEQWSSGDAFDDITVYYISVRSRPSLFSAPYKDMDELVAELYKSYNDSRERDKRLPRISKEQVRKNLRLIQGTYYA